MADGWGTLPHSGSGTADNCHANGNGFSMGDCKPAVGFHTVTDGVSQIQLHSEPPVKLVFHDYITFQFYTTADDIKFVKFQPFLSEMVK